MEFDLQSCLETERSFRSDSVHEWEKEMASFVFLWNMLSANQSSPLITWWILVHIQEINKSCSLKYEQPLELAEQMAAANL